MLLPSALKLIVKSEGLCMMSTIEHFSDFLGGRQSIVMGKMQQKAGLF